MSKVLPILFNTEMVRVILREVSPKTTTRRCVKGYIPLDAVWGYTAFTLDGHISCRGTFEDGYGEKFFKLPCQKGDILYVRETWTLEEFYDGEALVKFKAGGEKQLFYETEGELYHKLYKFADDKWIPSIFMPKEVARIWLKVTDVRVECLQEMTGQDILREGIDCHVHPEADYFEGNQKMMFAEIWNSTIKKADLESYGWDANPWVWVLAFERCEKPEST